MFLDGSVTRFPSNFIRKKELGNVIKGNSSVAESLQLTLDLGDWINKLILSGNKTLALG